MPSNRDSPGSARPGSDDSWVFDALELDPRTAAPRALAQRPSWIFDVPGQGAWFGLGEALTLEGSAERPAEVVDRAERLLDSMTPVRGAPSPRPVFLGGLAFDPAHTNEGAWAGFPASRWVLPEVLVHSSGDAAWAIAVARHGEQARLPELLARLDAPVNEVPSTRARPVHTDSLTSPEQWQRSVGRILNEIRLGGLSKAVLARAIHVQLDHELDAHALARLLRTRFPGCIVYLAHHAGRTFVGATPELLFARHGDRLETMALAGSAPRDPDPGRDVQLARALLGSVKDRREHAMVVDAIRAALEPLSVELGARGPTVRTLPNIQHLETEIRTQLAPSTSSAAILEAMHPTPAVCGTPRAHARELLRALEPEARGWYAGALGVVGHDCATFAVALRCLLLEGTHARAFVGAGIVEGSDARLEWDETTRKSEAMLRALEELSA